jgi:3'-phosphoadenosine 5'-phosphosulfate sulfotransferase (PAPS reductase)/FAD synthetase
MERFYDIKVHQTVSKHKDMFGFLKHAGYFPNSAARGCTERLKQEPFAAWMIDQGFTPENCEIWFGMRGTDESATRTGKYGGLEGGDVFHLGDISEYYAEGWRKGLKNIEVRLPIVDWLTSQVFKHIADEGAPINELYAKGHDRVGCYPCLLARKSEWVAAGQDPVGRVHIARLLQQQYEWNEAGNPRKLSKTVHPKWDVVKFLNLKDGQALPDLTPDECGWCSI